MSDLEYIISLKCVVEAESVREACLEFEYVEEVLNDMDNVVEYTVDGIRINRKINRKI